MISLNSSGIALSCCEAFIHLRQVDWSTEVQLGIKSVLYMKNNSSLKHPQTCNGHNFSVYKFKTEQTLMCELHIDM